jgi:DNA-binding LytR/AlgR family response regulator
MTKTAIIVDDEITLIDYLQKKLAQLWPELEIAGTAVNGRQAIALATETQPDIAFLDIHMPGLNGLQVAEALPADTQIVFVTAFDEFAVQAFEQAAVDYLLKPVSDTRLQAALDRLRAEDNNNRDALMSLLRDLNPQANQHLAWIRAGLDDTTELVPVNDVVFFQADQKYTTVATAHKDYVVRKSIKDLELELDPNQFWRIHRGTIVRVDQIVNAKRDLRGRYTITLRDRPESLRASQSYGHLFKQM